MSPARRQPEKKTSNTPPPLSDADINSLLTSRPQPAPGPPTTHIYRGIWTEPIPLPSPSRNTVRCPHCRVPIAASTTPGIKMVEFDDDETGSEASRTVPIGVKFVLEPGYVNARSRHASGAHWYVFGTQGRRSPHPSPKVRLPAIVTCRCGRETELRGDEDAPAFAKGSEEERQAKLADILDAEAQDQINDMNQPQLDELREMMRGEKP